MNHDEPEFYLHVPLTNIEEEEKVERIIIPKVFRREDIWNDAYKRMTTEFVSKISFIREEILEWKDKKLSAAAMAIVKETEWITGNDEKVDMLWSIFNIEAMQELIIDFHQVYRITQFVKRDYRSKCVFSDNLYEFEDKLHDLRKLLEIDLEINPVKFTEPSD